MSLLIKGGPAGSGTKRPLQAKAADWTCPRCARQNRYWAGNCPNCYTARPDAR